MVITVVVEILTTDGINFSAKSAKEAGASFEFTKVEKFISYRNLKPNAPTDFLPSISRPTILRGETLRM